MSARDKADGASPDEANIVDLKFGRDRLQKYRGSKILL
jgi:hypothetical protein